jgi:hypothetical protein
MSPDITFFGCQTVLAPVNTDVPLQKGIKGRELYRAMNMGFCLANQSVI